MRTEKANTDTKKRKAIEDGNRPAKRLAVIGSALNAADKSDLPSISERGTGITYSSQGAKDLEITEREADRVAAYNRQPQRKIAGIKKSKSSVTSCP